LYNRLYGISTTNPQHLDKSRCCGLYNKSTAHRINGV
jgi:hypothetical protein